MSDRACIGKSRWRYGEHGRRLERIDKLGSAVRNRTRWSYDVQCFEGSLAVPGRLTERRHTIVAGDRGRLNQSLRPFDVLPPRVIVAR